MANIFSYYGRPLPPPIKQIIQFVARILDLADNYADNFGSEYSPGFYAHAIKLATQI